MASLIPGYEYDIFISYRQKDNKHDGWVTEFVDNLKGELESTFKEAISVYFDINPHDGLLDTHDVEASLKDKLKCLVFIPIISRTYCDPKSFAWEHEFKSFIDQASKDHFGLKIKLPNGNVANRMIPVQIHDLYSEDKALFEKEIGAVLRAIEFIYREPGINKPLTADDDEKKNLNNTKFRLQINKVANAIDEVIRSLIGLQNTTDGKAPQDQSSSYVHKDGKSNEPSRATLINHKSKKWLIMVLSVILFVAGVLGIFKIIEGSKKADDIAKLEKSIAVLPFVNDSPDQENSYFINGIMEEILNNLQKIRDFRVLSRTSVEKYRGQTNLSIPEIAKELDVNNIVEGSGQKYGNTFRLRVQLISTKNEKHLWGESYEQEIKDTKDIFGIQSQVAQAIASELKATITPDEKKLIEKTSTTNLSAYDFYKRGEEERRQYEIYNNDKKALKRAEELYYKALDYDSTFAPAYTGLAFIYTYKNYSATFFSKNYLDSLLILADHALSYDDHLAEGYYCRALYYISNGNTEQGSKELDKALKYNPNYCEAYSSKGWFVYINDINFADYVKGLDYLHKAISINHGIERAGLLTDLGNAYGYQAGFPDEAKYYYQEAFKLDNDTNNYLFKIGSLEIQYGNFDKGIALTRKAYANDTNNTYFLWALGTQYLHHGQYKESLKYFKKWIEKLKSNGEFPMDNQRLIGYAYLQNGYKKEAEYWFNEQKRFSEESIKLGRFYFNYVWGAYIDLASIYAFTGEKEKAYKLLRIIDRNSIFSLNIVDDLKKYNPFFDGIRNEPEFQKIVKDMESKYQAEHERVRKWLEEQRKL